MSEILMEGLQVRDLRMEDVEAVTDLINQCDQHDLHESNLEVEDMRREWQTPDLELASNLHAVFDGEKIVAYAERWGISPPYTRIYGFFRVHPSYRERGIEDYLLHWIESTAREINIPKAPPEARVYLINGYDSRMTRELERLTQHGYSYVRSFYRMVVTFDGEPKTEPFPEGIELRPFMVERDLRPVADALDEAFQDHFGHTKMDFEKWSHWVLNEPRNDFEQWYVAYAGNEIAGVCLCMTDIPEKPNYGFVEDLAVRRPYRKLGLGTALLRHAFKGFYQRGRLGAALGVDSENLTGALRLYERAGMAPDETYHRYEKTIREGVELATITL
ncbi:MAG: hypothetical protein OHK0023_28100 [Anaerolineae bacterium]